MNNVLFCGIFLILIIAVIIFMVKSAIHMEHIRKKAYKQLGIKSGKQIIQYELVNRYYPHIIYRDSYGKLQEAYIDFSKQS